MVRHFCFISSFFTFISILLLSSDGMAGENREIRVPYYRQKANDTSIGYKERILFLDSLVQCSQEKDRGSLYLKMGKIAENNFDYHQSASLYNKAFDSYPYDSVRMKSLAAASVSRSWFRLYKYNESVKWNTITMQIHRPDSLLWIDMNQYAELCAIADKFKLSTLFAELIRQMESRMKKFQKSTATNDRKSLGEARYYNALGNYLLSRSDGEEAMKAYSRASELTSDTNTYFAAMINIGNTYCALNKPELARPILEEMVTRKSSQELIAAIDLCNAYLMLEMADSCESILKKYIDPMDIPKESGLAHFPFMIRADIAACRGNYEEAYNNQLDGYILFRKSYNEGDFIFAGEIEKSIREAANIGLNCKWYKRPGLFGWSFIFLILLELFSIIIVVWWFGKRKRARNERKRLVDVSYEKLIGAGNLREAEEKLYKERCKSDNLTVENLRMRELLHSIEQETRKSKTLSNLSSFILSRVKDMNMTTTAIGKRMQLHEQTDHDFMKALCEAHPDLTKAEREVCAYIHLGFSPKEIAATTNRSIKTINTLRHRIRTKIGISPDLTIDAYLLKI